MDHTKAISLLKLSSPHLSTMNKLSAFKGWHLQSPPHLPDLILEILEMVK